MAKSNPKCVICGWRDAVASGLCDDHLMEAPEIMVCLRVCAEEVAREYRQWRKDLRKLIHA